MSEIESEPSKLTNQEKSVEPRQNFDDNNNNSYYCCLQFLKKPYDNDLMELYKKPEKQINIDNSSIQPNINNYKFIIKYMKNDESLLEDLKQMSPEKKQELLNELNFLQLPIKLVYLNELYINEDALMMKAWKNRIIMVNGKNAPDLNMYLKKNGLFDMVFNKINIEKVKYYKENNIIYTNLKLEYGDFIEDYCKNGIINGDLLVIENLKYENVINEMKTLGIDVDENELYQAWKKNRYIYVNNEYKENINNWIKQLDLFKNIYYDNKNEQVIIKDNNNNNHSIIYINIILKYGDFIDYYCQYGKINEELIKKEGNENTFDMFENELYQIRITLNEEEKKKAMKHFNDFLFKESLILFNEQYDHILQEWLGFQYKWKLIYRAFEHNYSAKSFHEYCDDQGPTLIIIKSSEGWIFGGFTTKSWRNTTSNIYELKDDSNAFIFTLKNPYNIPPTKYNKRKESEFAIKCNPYNGPIFGNDTDDLFITDNCSQSRCCYVGNNGRNGYECNSQYRKSLFVNSNAPDETNYFMVAEYEVYAIDN